MALKTRSKKMYNNKTRKQRVFTAKDYNSGDGMLTSSWGPAQWHVLHMMSFNYPVNPTKEDKINYKNHILSLRNVLPCKYCRMNLTKNLKAFPLTMEHMKSRDTFSRYVYDLHEMVNKMLKKKSGLSYCDVRERYEHFRSRCTQDKPKLFEINKVNLPEKGCTEPLYGKKSKCIIKIVPQEDKEQTFQMDKNCLKRRKTMKK
jgi:hypothetical protein